MPELIERGPNTNTTMTSILGVVNQALGIVLTSFTVLLLSFYLLVEGDDMFHGFLQWMPAEARPRWSRMASDAGVKVGAWMSGQFVLCMLVGTSATIGFWIIGLPYFYVLGLICGLGEMVPLIGPIVAAIPAVLVSTTVGLNAAVITTIFIFVQQQVENNIIIPRLMQKQTGISPILVMVAILIGGSLLGVVGALLAVPTAAVIQIMVREYLAHRETL
jgi:predicted PurR-regulated permease PerM